MSLKRYYFGLDPAPELVDRIKVLIFDPQVGEIQTTLGELKDYFAVAGGGIPEAPQDGKFYVRRNGAWEEFIIT